MIKIAVAVALIATVAIAVPASGSLPDHPCAPDTMCKPFAEPCQNLLGSIVAGNDQLWPVYAYICGMGEHP
jgi:hypothetical protein